MRWFVYVVLGLLIVFTVLTLIGVVDLYKNECGDRKNEKIEYYNSILDLKDVESVCGYSDFKQVEVTFRDYIDDNSGVRFGFVNNLKLDFMKSFSGEDANVVLSVSEYDSVESAKQNYLYLVSEKKSSKEKIKSIEEENDSEKMSFSVVYESGKVGDDENYYFSVGSSNMYLLRDNKVIDLVSSEVLVYNETGEGIKQSICNIEQIKGLASIVEETVSKA